MHFVGALAIMILCINVVIKAAGEIVIESVKTKIALKLTNKKYLRKNLMACREIRVYLNSVFYFEKNTCTVFVDSLINNTITVALAM